MKVKSESEVAQSCPTLAAPWTAAHQALLSMRFARQEYWSGLPLPSPSMHIYMHPIHECSIEAAATNVKTILTNFTDENLGE